MRHLLLPAVCCSACIPGMMDIVSILADCLGRLVLAALSEIVQNECNYKLHQLVVG